MSFHIFPCSDNHCMGRRCICNMKSIRDIVECSHRNHSSHLRMQFACNLQMRKKSFKLKFQKKIVKSLPLFPYPVCPYPVP